MWLVDYSRNLSLKVVFLVQIFHEEYQRAHLTEGIEKSSHDGVEMIIISYCWVVIVLMIHRIHIKEHISLKI